MRYARFAAEDTRDKSAKGSPKQGLAARKSRESVHNREPSPRRRGAFLSPSREHVPARRQFPCRPKERQVACDLFADLIVGFIPVQVDAAARKSSQEAWIAAGFEKARTQSFITSGTMALGVLFRPPKTFCK